MRKVKIDSAELLELMQERNKYVEMNQAVVTEGSKLEEELKNLSDKLKKQSTKLSKVEDKIRPIARQLTSGLTGAEFEIVKDIIIEEGELFAVIVDQVEEYKNILRDRANKKVEQAQK